jgi:hypothetical protein
MTLAIELGAALLALLCALALLWSHWPGWLKGMLLVAVTVFYFFAHDEANNIAGWASNERMPERFQLLAAVIEEPTTKSPGALYLWVNAVENGKPAAQPRAYRLPYTKDLHALLNDSLRKIRQGVSQIGTLDPKRGRQGPSWLRPGSDEQVIKLRDMPAPQLPEK